MYLHYFDQTKQQMYYLQRARPWRVPWLPLLVLAQKQQQHHLQQTKHLKTAGLGGPMSPSSAKFAKAPTSTKFAKVPNSSKRQIRQSAKFAKAPNSPNANVLSSTKRLLGRNGNRIGWLFSWATSSMLQESWEWKNLVRINCLFISQFKYNFKIYLNNFIQLKLQFYIIVSARDILVKKWCGEPHLKN